MKCVRARVVITLLALFGLAAQAQTPQFSPGVRSFIKVDAPVVVLTHVRVIDGTGAAPRENQTLVLRDGTIVGFGDTGTQAHPQGATVLDLTGETPVLLRPGGVTREALETLLGSIAAAGPGRPKSPGELILPKLYGEIGRLIAHGHGGPDAVERLSF